jgi:tetratricopeptide (TPR) repeat protein
VLEFRAPLIGREMELASLLEHLERARSGHGSIVVISGEAGIGKTRLLEELKARARSLGVQVLAGSSLYESLTPYMPFFEALRSGGLEQLLAEHAPRVEGIYLLTDTGLLIKSVGRTESTKLDSDVFAGMLTAVNNFVRDSLAMIRVEDAGDAMRRLDYGDYSILVEHEAGINLAVIITGKETEFLIGDMKDRLEDIHRKYGKRLGPWTGEEQDVVGLENLLSPLMVKYDGLSYAEVDPKARRDLLFENVSLGLARQTTLSAVLFCLEDLQWADPSTLALVHYVAKTASTRGLLIVGTYRPEDLASEDGRTHHLTEALQRMSRDHLYETMKLERLPEESSAAIIRSLLEAPDLDNLIVHRLHTEAAGNPFFMIELAKLMVEEGMLSKVDASWIPVRDLVQADIPVRIHDVVARRANRLDMDLRGVLDCASVIGEEYDSDVLASALNIDKMLLLRALATLEKKHRLVRSGNERYRFDHIKIKEVLYAELPAELKKEYHERVAVALTPRAESDGNVAGDIAFHYLRSNSQERALPYLKTAAEHAANRFSNEEAIRFYSEALNIQQDSAKKIRLLEAVGAIFELIGEYSKALVSFDRALDLPLTHKRRAQLLAKKGMTLRYQGNYAESVSICNKALSLVLGDANLVEARILNNIGMVNSDQGEYEQAGDCHRKSLAIREKIGDQRGIADSLSNLGVVHRYKGEYEQAVDCHRKSLAIREKIGDQRGIAESLSILGVDYSFLGDYEQTFDCWRRSLQFMEKIGDQRGIAVLLHNLGAAHGDRGNYEEALEYDQRSMRYMEKIGEQRGIASLLSNLGNLHRDRGDYDEALGCISRSLTIKEKLGDQDGIARSLSNLGLVLGDQGEYERALDCQRKSLAIRERIGDQPGVAESLRNIGVVLGQQGDYTEALAFANRSFEIADRVGDLKHRLAAQVTLATIYFRTGDLETAQHLCDLTLAGSTQANLKKLVLESRKILGMIHRERNVWSESTKNFEESIQGCAEIGNRLGEAEAHYEFGVMWKKRGETAQARQHLLASVMIFEKIKAARDLQAAKEALGQIGM